MTDEQKIRITQLRTCERDISICDECVFSDGNVSAWRSLMGMSADLIEIMSNEIDKLKTELANAERCIYGSMSDEKRANEEDGSL